MHPTEAGLTRATTATSWGGPTPAAATATANQRRAERAYLHKRQPHPSGQMLGFFPIVLASGLVINDCRLMKGKTGLWVALPSQRQVDSDGPARTGPDGKPIYSPLLEFSDKQTSNRLLDLCLGLIKRVDPDALAYEDLS